MMRVEEGLKGRYFDRSGTCIVVIRHLHFTLSLTVTLFLSHPFCQLVLVHVLDIFARNYTDPANLL